MIVAGVIAYNLLDVDRVKAHAVQQLESLTGRKVTVGRAELDWGKGVSVRMRDVSIANRSQSDPEFEAQSVWVVVKLLPLMEQKWKWKS